MSALCANPGVASLPPPKPLTKQHRIYPSRLPGAPPRRREHKRSSAPLRRSVTQVWATYYVNSINGVKICSSENTLSLGAGCHNGTLDIFSVYLTRADHTDLLFFFCLGFSVSGSCRQERLSAKKRQKKLSCLLWSTSLICKGFFSRLAVFWSDES